MQNKPSKQIKDFVIKHSQLLSKVNRDLNVYTEVLILKYFKDNGIESVLQQQIQGPLTEVEGSSIKKVASSTAIGLLVGGIIGAGVGAMVGSLSSTIKKGETDSRSRDMTEYTLKYSGYVDYDIRYFFKTGNKKNLQQYLQYMYEKKDFIQKNYEYLIQEIILSYPYSPKGTIRFVPSFPRNIESHLSRIIDIPAKSCIFVPNCAVGTFSDIAIKADAQYYGTVNSLPHQNMMQIHFQSMHQEHRLHTKYCVDQDIALWGIEYKPERQYDRILAYCSYRDFNGIEMDKILTYKGKKPFVYYLTEGNKYLSNSGILYLICHYEDICNDKHFWNVLNNNSCSLTLDKLYRLPWGENNIHDCLLFVLKNRNKVNSTKINYIDLTCNSGSETEVQISMEVTELEMNLKLSASALRIQRDFSNYKKDVHVKKHAIGQRLFALSSDWDCLQTIRRKNNGVLNDFDTIGKHGRAASIIFDQIDNLLSVIKEQVNSFTYVDDIEKNYPKETISISDAVKRYIKLNKTEQFECLLVESSTLKISNNTASDEVSLSSKALDEILTNLFYNAVKHGFKNAQKHIIRISINTEGSKIIVAVSNNGVPLKDGIVDKIFDYGQTTETGKDNHSGLGCYQVKSLTQLLRFFSVFLANQRFVFLICFTVFYKF